MGISLGFGHHLRFSIRLWPRKRHHYRPRMPRGYHRHPTKPAVYVIQPMKLPAPRPSHTEAQFARYRAQAARYMAFRDYERRHPDWKTFYPWYVPPVDPYMPGTHTKLSETLGR